MKKKINPITIVLFVLILILVGSIFYISFIISNEPDSTASTEKSAVQTKATKKTYSKTFTTSTKAAVVPSATSIPILTSTTQSTTITPAKITPSPIISITPSTSLSPILSPVLSPILSPNVSPTPTEILLAKINTTLSPTKSVISSYGTTISPTKTAELPESGFINNAIIMFTVSGLLIFFAFLF